MKKIISILLIILFCTPLEAAISLLQHTQKDAGTVLSTTLAYGSNEGEHNTNLVFVRGGNTLNYSVVVTDTNNNVYIQDYIDSASNTDHGIVVFRARDVKAGPCTITVTFGQSHSMRLAIFEYSGLDGLAPRDIAGQGATSGTTRDTGSMNITQAETLYITFHSDGNDFASTLSIGNGFTIREQIHPSGDLLTVADTIITSSGSFSISGNWSDNVSDFWNSVLFSYKGYKRRTNIGGSL